MSSFFEYELCHLKSLLIIIMLVLSAHTVFTQDSLYLYKSGKIIYRIEKYQLDSFTTHPIGYYEKYRNSKILEFIRSNSQCTTFAKMIEIAGFQNKLDSRTIWIPINDALKDIDLTDTLTVKRIVYTSMIKGFLYYKSFQGTTTIQTLNNKKIKFFHEGTTCMADGNELLETDIECMNSLINISKGYNKGTDNIGEYLMSPNVCSEMATFVKNHVSMKDSLYQNDINLPSSLFCEDSITTALVPDTKSWTETYNFLYPCCVVPNDDENKTKQSDYVKSLILQDCFIRGNLLLPPEDTLTATSGNLITNLQVLLDTQKQTELSNGVSYSISDAPFFKKNKTKENVIVEAEDSSLGRSNLNSTVSISSYNAGNYDISANKYLKVEPSTVSLSNFSNVTFPIVGTFTQKYNIYCSILPGSVIDTANHKPTKLRFYISYQDSTGALVNAYVNSSNNFITSSGVGATFVTTPNLQNKMFVTQIDLPFCNLSRNNPTLYLKIEDVVKITEISNYDRTFYIDSIILEPVE